MRFPVKKSTSLLGVAALAASLGPTACGGDDGGGSDDNDVTIWSSVDTPVREGLTAVLTEKATPTATRSTGRTSTTSTS